MALNKFYNYHNLFFVCYQGPVATTAAPSTTLMVCIREYSKRKG